MFRKFQGAKISCEICKENESFKVGLNRNITEQDMIFSQQLKDEGWGKIPNTEFDLCPKHYREYQEAEEKEKWRAKHNLL